MTAVGHVARRHALTLDPLPGRSGAGLPLANGLLGALVWGDGTDLILSLDRTDLWDLRLIPEYAGSGYTNDALAGLVEAGAMDAIDTRFEAPYRRPAPTKLPGGRMRVGGVTPSAATLDLWRAEVVAGGLRTVVDADSNIGLLWGSGGIPALTIESPAYGRAADATVSDMLSPHRPEDLDYPLPQIITEVARSGYIESLPDGRAVCVLLGWRDVAAGWEAAWTIVIAGSGDAAGTEAEQCIAAALKVGFAKRLARHRAWWEVEWGKVDLTLPDPTIERQWALDAYKFIAAARRGAPPVALQGPWTLDNGRLPPWKGDYHHDLNTQMTYWPALTGNRLDAHLGFLDWLWDTRDACREWTRSFFQVEGLAVPMTADIANRQLGGWAPYTHSATSGAWLAQHFVTHWRMTGDEAFLRDRAWPYVRETCIFIDALTRRDARAGKRALRLSSSPEIGDNRREAWFADWTNYDLMLCRAALDAAVAMTDILGLADERRRWLAVVADLPQPALDDLGGFAVAPGVPATVSHRHFSYLVMAHPLRLVAPDDPRVVASIATLEQLGTANWMGYTFAWMAGLYAFAGDGAAAARMLGHFASAFCGPNSFHTNGEVGDERLTIWPFDAFTLEGNCAAMAAIQDMLLQSSEGVIRLFPAVPPKWRDLEFSGLLAEGGITVAASLSGGRVDSLTLSSKRTQQCRVVDADGTGLDVEIIAGRTRILDWPALAAHEDRS